MILRQWLNKSILHCFSSNSKNKYDKDYSIDFHCPDEILIEILSRVPADRLEVFKTVCHHWRVLLSSYELFKLHMKRVRDKAIDRPVVLLHYGTVAKDIIQWLVNLRNVRGNWKRCDVECVVVGSCDGLLMFKRQGGESVIFNPITQETRIIKSSGNNGGGLFIFFDRFEDDYKLLHLFPCTFLNVDNDYDYIYSFNRDEWERLVSPGKSSPLGCSNGPPVLVSDALHWISSGGLVLVFKIETKDLFLPYPNSMITDANCDLSWESCNHMQLMEKDGKLCLCHAISSRQVIEIWVLQDYGNWGSWARKFKVDLLRVSNKCNDARNIPWYKDTLRTTKIVSFDDDNILLAWQNRGFYLCNLKRKRIKVIEKPKFLDTTTITRHGYYDCIPFIKTLVSPNNVYTTL